MVRETPVATGIVAWHDTKAAGDINITTVDHDFHDQDIADALTSSIATDGQSIVTADIPFNSHKITGLANGSAASDAAAFGQIPLANAVLLQTQTVGSAVSSVDFTGLTTAYNGFIFELFAVTVSGVGSLALRVQQSAAFQTTNYYGTLINYDSGGGTVVNNSSAISFLPLSAQAPSVTGWGGTIKLIYPQGPASAPNTPAEITIVGGNMDVAGTKHYISLGAGTRIGTAAAVTGIRFFTSGGNITGGILSLYGIKS